MSNLIVAPRSALDDPFEYLKGLKGKSVTKRVGLDQFPSDLPPTLDYDKEIDIASMIMDAIEDTTLVPKDIKIDDGDIPQATNFYQWCTDDRFAGTVMVPFLEQLIWGVITFAEYCVYCSDLNWLYDTHKVGDSLLKFERKVALLEYGVCPHCKKTRSQMVKNGDMNFYQELAVNAGQRCVTGDTLVQTRQGLVRIDSFSMRQAGFSRLEVDIFNGSEFETTTRFYEAEPEPVFRVFVGEDSICGTKDHPIFTKSKGFCEIGNLTEGDLVFYKGGFHAISRIVADGIQPTYDFTLPITHRFSTGHFLSHNSGKSAAVGGMLAPYLTHRMLKLQKPSAVYGVAASTVLHGTFVALTYAQAKETLWEFFFGTLLESQWFQDYHNLLNYYSEKYGQQLIKFNDTFVQYRARGILVYPSGPDKRVLRGRTRFLACIPGDTLISTNKGLVRMDKIKLGTRVNIGAVNAPIVRHEHTGKKRLWKLTLKTGQELKASAEHKVLCYRNGKAVKVEVSELQPTDGVMYALGGEFPTKCDLTPYIDVPRFVDERHRLVHYMLRLKTFTYTSLIEASQTTRIRASVGVFVSKLVRQGLVIKRQQAGPYKTYSVTSCLNEQDFLDTRNKGAYEYRHDIEYPTEMTETLAYILGYLTGDEACKNKLRFKTLDKRRTSHFIRCVKDVFGLYPNYGTYLETIGKHGNRNEHQVRNFYGAIELNAWVAYFRRIGVDAVGSARKEVPHTILGAPRACVIAYLKALFECDAKTHGNKFTYRTISIKLAQQVQQLLFRLGINCVLGKNPGVYLESNYLYHVQVDPGFYNRFIKVFGGKLTISSIVLRPMAPRYWFEGKTKYKNLWCSAIASVVETDEVVDVYDMTVDHKRHAYVANGVLVKNSIDELGWFDPSADSQKVKTSAREVYDALDQSLLTVRGAADRLINSGFNDVPHGYAFNVSSPSSQSDKICELVRIAATSTTIYGIHRPTWEVNPSLPRNCKAIQDAFRKDPIKAERNLGANPPLSANPYISNTEWIENALGDYPNRIKLVDRILNKQMQDRATKWADIDKLGYGKKASIMALDAGYSSNSFGCVIGSLTKDNTVRVALLVEIMPDPGIPLNYTMIYNSVLLELVDHFNVKLVLADRWNSLKILSDLEIACSIASDQYSLKYKDIGLTRSYLESGSLTLPRFSKGTSSVEDAVAMSSSGYPKCYKNKPVEHLALQMLTVQDSGTTVTKGDGYTDDLWRAMCLLIWGLTNEKYKQFLEAPDLEPEKTRPDAIAVSRLSSGGGNSLGTGSSMSFGGTLGVLKKGK